MSKQKIEEEAFVSEKLAIFFGSRARVIDGAIARARKITVKSVLRAPC